MRTARIKTTATFIGVILLIIGIMSLFPEESSDDKEVPRQTQQPKQVQIVDNTLYFPYGTSKIMLGKEYSADICPPKRKRSYTKIEREDKSVGLTYLVQRQNKEWSEPIYEPPRKEIRLGYFVCIRIKSDTPTSAKVTISKTAQ